MLNYVLINDGSKTLYYNKNIQFNGTIEEYVDFIGVGKHYTRVMLEQCPSYKLNSYNLATILHLDVPSKGIRGRFKEISGDILL